MLENLHIILVSTLPNKHIKLLRCGMAQHFAANRNPHTPRNGNVRIYFRQYRTEPSGGLCAVLPLNAVYFGGYIDRSLSVLCVEIRIYLLCVGSRENSSADYGLAFGIFFVQKRDSVSH